MPHIGSFFSERYGIWQNVRQTNFQDDLIMNSSMLQDTLKIVRNEHGVPHIWASNQYDALWGLGYITATDRYFQLFLLPNIIAGKTASWFGDSYLETDKAFLNLGLEKAAWDIHNNLSDEEYKLIRAYQSGINSYINNNFGSRKPMEFKMLNLDIRYWRPIDVIRTFLFWRYLTSYNEQDIYYQKAIDSLGVEQFTKFYNLELNSSNATLQNSDGILAYIKEQRNKRERFFGTKNSLIEATLTGQILSGERKARYDLNIASPMTLPSIFYEVQITLPESNRYGVTVPGIPALLYGFNNHIFFGQVNADSDPVNFYSFDSGYSAIDSVIQTKNYKIVSNSGRSLSHSVNFTRAGPLLEISGSNIVQSWKGSAYKNDLTTLWNISGLQHANISDTVFKDISGPMTGFIIGDSRQLQLFEAGLQSPVQRGIIPYLSAFNQTEKVIREDGFLKFASIHSKNEQVNQHFWRQARLDSLTFKNLRNKGIQSNIADDVALSQKVIIQFMEDKISGKDMSELKGFVEDISSWDYNAGTDSKAPVILEKFMRIARSKIWDELGTLKYPSDEVWVNLLFDKPAHPFFDIKSTPEKENAFDVLKLSLNEALNLSKMEFGNPESWNWSALTNIETSHISGIQIFNDFSAEELIHTGFEGTINTLPNRNRNFGSAWRLVAAFEGTNQTHKIMSISGVKSNPFSIYFKNGVNDWRTNTYRTIPFNKNYDVIDEAPSILIYPLH